MNIPATTFAVLLTFFSSGDEYLDSIILDQDVTLQECQAGVDGNYTWLHWNPQVITSIILTNGYPADSTWDVECAKVSFDSP